jgi:hypothetical protein
MDNELKKKLLKMRGTVSEQEVDYISNLVPTTNNFVKSITGVTGLAASEKEIEYLRKNLPNTNDFIKSITGVAASPKEMEYLKKRLPKGIK